MNAETHRSKWAGGPGASSLFCLGFILFGVSYACGAPEYLATAVAGVDPVYKRDRDDAGKYKPEYYSFGEGGKWGGLAGDTSIDKLSFMDLAHLVAPSLRSQNYVPATDPKKARLLIMLYWGATDGAADGSSGSVASQNLAGANQNMARANAGMSTIHSGATWMNTFPPGGIGKNGDALQAQLSKEAADGEMQAALAINAMANRLRDQQNWRNAGMLGYETEYAGFADQQFTALRNRYRDAMEEIEENRYFVVLMAYDFQRLLTKKEHVLLWETRISIRQHGNDLDQSVALMAGYGSRFYGQDSKGLIREQRLRESIRMDELKIIGVVPDPNERDLQEKFPHGRLMAGVGP